MSDRVVTMKEAAVKANVSYRTMRRWVEKKIVRAYRPKGFWQWMVYEDSIPPRKEKRFWE